MTDKLELKSGHEVVYTVYVADVESIFYCKPDDPDILTVLMNDGKRLYCDEVCPIYSLQEEPASKDFEMALTEMVAKAQRCVVEPWMVAAQWKDELIKLAKSEEPVSEQNLSNVDRTVKEWKEPVSEDLELTWKDMRELYIIFAEVDTEIELCKADNIKSETIGYFQEVSKRFKDYKERKEK